MRSGVLKPKACNECITGLRQTVSHPSAPPDSLTVTGSRDCTQHQHLRCYKGVLLIWKVSPGFQLLPY